MQNDNNVNQTIRITWDKTENPYKNNLFHKFLHNIFFFLDNTISFDSGTCTVISTLGAHFKKIMHVTKYVFYTLSAVIYVTKQVFYTLPAFKGGHIEVYVIRLSKSILTFECSY